MTERQLRHTGQLESDRCADVAADGVVAIRPQRTFLHISTIDFVGHAGRFRLAHVHAFLFAKHLHRAQVGDDVLSAIGILAHLVVPQLAHIFARCRRLRGRARRRNVGAPRRLIRRARRGNVRASGWLPVQLPMTVTSGWHRAWCGLMWPWHLLAEGRHVGTLQGWHRMRRILARRWNFRAREIWNWMRCRRILRGHLRALEGWHRVRCLLTRRRKVRAFERRCRRVSLAPDLAVSAAIHLARMRPHRCPSVAICATIEGFLCIGLVCRRKLRLQCRHRSLGELQAMGGQDRAPAHHLLPLLVEGGLQGQKRLALPRIRLPTGYHRPTNVGNSKWLPTMLVEQ